ncbi:hypothetical protein PQX77_000365 [Marasmius sp. AFHP31]|nr:hypothetical protein PQX77_000365 [Marasmius sp. AFHP31]
MDPPVVDSTIYATDPVEGDGSPHRYPDEMAFDASLSEGNSSFNNPEAPYTDSTYDTRRVNDDPSSGSLLPQVGPSRTVRRRTRKASPVVAASGGGVPEIVSLTVAKPTVLEAALARRKKPGKYRCHLCPATFTEKHGVTNHVNSHYGIKPHQCTRCDKSFGTTHTRNRHVKTCRGSKPMPQEVTFVDMAH